MSAWKSMLLSTYTWWARSGDPAARASSAPKRATRNILATPAASPKRTATGSCSDAPRFEASRLILKVQVLRAAAAPVSRINHMPGPRRRHARLHRRVRFLAALHALKKVLHVVDRPIAKTLRPHHRIVSPQRAFVIHAEPASVQLHR